MSSEENSPTTEPLSLETSTSAAAGTNDQNLTSTSSGLVVGPLASVDCAAPTNSGNATPPTIPGEGEKSDSSCNTTNMPFLSFTAKTCIELLHVLTDDQIEFEYNVFNRFSNENLAMTRGMSTSRKRDFLKKQLVENLSSEFENIVNNVCLPLNFKPSTQSLFSREIEDTVVTDVTQQVPAAAAHSEPPLPANRQNVRLTLNTSPHNPGNLQLIEPVCRFENISFDELNVNEVAESCTFKKEGARKVAYFGAVEYKYGKISHPPQPYPETEFFDNIFNKLSTIDSNFTRQNFSCMINKYDNGDAAINQHSDNEWIIKPDSTIYTISLGATRTIKFINVKGPLDIRRHPLIHGSVFGMQASSQAQWTHGLDPEPGISEARISLTFRYMSETPPPARQKAPPVRRPTAHPAEEVLKPFCAPPGQCDRESKRVLFLTDSILNGFQPHMFRELTGHVCIKKTNYDLVNFINFKDEFQYSDIVVLSGGVNDIARNGHSAESLADLVFARLDQCLRDYPSTKFVVNSMILTKLNHINEHILRFNKYLKNFCLHNDNLIFFNSHAFMEDNNHKVEGQIYDPLDRNGIHVTYQVRRLIGLQLVRYMKQNCTNLHVRYDSTPMQMGRRSWPVR